MCSIRVASHSTRMRLRGRQYELYTLPFFYPLLHTHIYTHISAHIRVRARALAASTYTPTYICTRVFVHVGTRKHFAFVMLVGRDARFDD